MGGLITIMLDGDPVGKGRPRFTRATGRVYTPKETEAYEEALRWQGRAAMRGQRMLVGALEVLVIAYVSIPESWSASKRDRAARGLERPTSRPDGDNYLKIALDAMNKIVWQDDAQATDIVVRKRYALKPALHIFARQIEAAELVGKAA